MSLVIKAFEKEDYIFLLLYTKELKLSMCFGTDLQSMQAISQCCAGKVAGVCVCFLVFSIPLHVTRNVVGACKRVKRGFDSINKILFSKANRFFVLFIIPTKPFATHSCRVTIAVVR